MSTARMRQHGWSAWLVFIALACQDRTLNFLPGSLQPVAGAGGSAAMAGTNSAGQATDTAGSFSGGGSFSGASSGGNGGTGGASAGMGGGDSFSGGGSAGNGGTGGASAGMGGGSFSGGGSGGNGGTGGASAGMGGTGGIKPCQTDADCAPPMPGCSPTLQVCKHCSNNSQCLNGKPCNAEGECE